MADNPNVYTIDNSELDGTSVVVPKDVPASATNDSYYTDSKEKTEVLIKVVNNTGQNFDATPAATSGDDQEFTEYDTYTNETATVSSGGSIPGSVETFRVEPSNTYHGVVLDSFAGDPTTGDVKVTIEHKTYSS